MKKNIYCWYKFRRRRLKKANGKICLVGSYKHEPFGVFSIVGKDIKELIIRGLYYGERIGEEWEKKERVIYYNRGGYIDKIIWGDMFSSERDEEGVFISGYMNLVDNEVKEIIEEELGEKVKEEIEFLPVIMRGRFWDDGSGKELSGEDIWGEVEVEKGGEIRGYYIINVLNKVYERDLKDIERRLKGDRNKLKEEIEKIYEGKIFVDYILDRYEPEGDKYIIMDTYIKEEYASKIDKRIKPNIYELKCDDLVEEELKMIYDEM